MQPACRDFTWWVGNDAPQIKVRLKDSDGAVIALTGSVIALRAVDAEGNVVIARTSEDDLPVDGDDYIDITPTLAESRLMPAGRQTRYEVERRIGGTQQTFLTGWIIAQGGVNLDD
jgi:hypothetical protein